MVHEEGWVSPCLKKKLQISQGLGGARTDLVLGWNQTCRDELVVFARGLQTVGTDGQASWAGMEVSAGVCTRGPRGARSGEHTWHLDSGF